MCVCEIEREKMKEKKISLKKIKNNFWKSPKKQNVHFIEAK